MTSERTSREVGVHDKERVERITQKLEEIMRDPDLVFELSPYMQNLILPGMVGMWEMTQAQVDRVLAAADETIDSLLTPEQKAGIDRELEQRRWAEEHRRTGRVNDFVSLQ